MAEDFVPFEEALKSLKISADELKRLVSEDEIQAIRDPSGSIRLRKADVDKLRRRAVDEVVDELDFADVAEADDTGMVTAVLEEDSLLEEEETLDMSPDEIGVDDAAPARRRAAATGGTSVRSRGRASGLRDDKPEGEESNLDRALLIGASVLLLYSLFVAYSIAQGQVTGLTRWLADMFQVN